jgi:hypothetical protein
MELLLTINIHTMAIYPSVRITGGFSLPVDAFVGLCFTSNFICDLFRIASKW